jgi:hypothetical protein
MSIRPFDTYARRGDREGWDEGNIITRTAVRLRPDEGYLALGLVLLLAGLVGWSIADSRWILGRDDLTRFLIPVGVAAGFWGYVAAKLPIAPWLGHVIGSVIGAFVVVEIVGSLMPGATPTLDGWLRAAAYSVSQAYLDLAWRHHISTLQYAHFCLILGIVVWGAAQAAAYDVFGHHRSMNGVILLSVVFMANMSLTISDQFRGLVLFSAAALLLLLFAHAADEKASWIRHRIWRGTDLRSPHLGGGVAFAGVAIAGAVILTTIATSAPLSSPLQSVNSHFSDVATWISGFLPAGGQSRYQPSGDFGYTTPIGSSFRATPGKAFTVTLATGTGSFHWRMVAYDQFQSSGWSVGETTQSNVAAGEQIGAGTLDQLGTSAVGRTEITYTIHLEDGSLRHLVSANEPASASADVGLLTIGVPGSLDIAAVTIDAHDYTVTANVPWFDPAGRGITEWLLRHASTLYPDGLLARYTQGTNFVGSDARNLLVEIGTWAKSAGNPFDTEFDIAKAVQAYLQSDRFTYTTDISADMATHCTGLSTADCFAVLRKGFCEQYATTMTMLMRLEGYPARYVQGYLPSPIDPATNSQLVNSSQKHAWVEVFFPDYGWIPFDPTGSVGQPTVLPAGAPASPRPSARRTSTIHEPGDGGAGGSGGSLPSDGPGSVPGGSGTSGGAGPIVIGTGLIAAAIALLAFISLRRPRRNIRAESAYQGIVAWASRLGYRPRASQTILEYTGMLADIVPSAREPLDVVAMAAIETAYSRRAIGEARLAGVTRAYMSVRRALVAMFLHLPGSRRR